MYAGGSQRERLSSNKLGQLNPDGDLPTKLLFPKNQELRTDYEIQLKAFPDRQIALRAQSIPASLFLLVLIGGKK